ncbi:hypothetical protein VNI00_006707 [Paramarasmius palmivorus]|uniref:Cytochrome P450 n=1 Tax=Paramarasmius palmivorus TaxID=297713 RepID=A0AAW0D568_9AGAR
MSTFEFGMPTTLFTISDPKEHSAIKSLFSSYFSRRSVQRLEHMVQGRVDKLISQLLKNHRASPVNMNHAYRSVTLDIITLYTLRTSIDATSFPSFQHPALHSIDEALLQTWFFRYFPFLRLTFHLPKWLAILLSPSSKPMAEMQEDIEKLVDKALQDYQQYDPDSDSDLNVFYTLLSNSRVEGKVRQSHRVTREWLIAEGVALRVAGSDTVGNACTIGTRCLMRDSRVRQKLVDELETAWPDKGLSMPLERLEKLPYLTAVIKESLRLSHGTVTPMSRVVSESGAVISGHPVPPGTIVSIASPFIDMNPDIFVDPTSFYPERWIEDKENTLNHYLVTFGKGPRSCLGINLAWSELYMILGNVFRKLDFHSDGDLQSEVDFGEFFVPLYKGDALSATVSERA